MIEVYTVPTLCAHRAAARPPACPVLHGGASSATFGVMAISDTTGVPLLAGSILGTRVLRTEDPGFLTTGAVYTDDLVDERLAGAVHATFVRSPVAHARIGSIDVSGAMDMPGVVAVLTAEDPGRRPSGR